MRRILTGFCAGAVLLSCGCKAPVLNSVWAVKPVALDGLSKDWSPNERDESAGFAFAAKNDAENLYLYVAPKSAKAKQYLAAAGAQNFTLWLDLDSRREKGLGLRLQPEEGLSGLPKRRLTESFAGANPPGPAGHPQNAPGGEVAGGEPEQAVSGSREFSGMPVKLLGFGETGKSGVAVKLGNVYIRGVLEVKIPLSMLGDETPSQLMVGLTADLPAASSKPGVRQGEGISSKSMGGSRPSGGPGGGGPGGSMGSGMGGAGGGDMRGAMFGASRGGGVSAATEDAEEPLEVWVTVILAKPAQAVAVADVKQL